ncbi:MAG: ribonuclease P protein component [Sporocytophaga sp.]|nr:ribonuclease P protein component [Sporocytophaga sp.]
MNGEHNGRILKATLPSEERLKSIKFIEELFKRGSSYFLHPFKIVYLADKKDNSAPPKILVSVPKKVLKGQSTETF